MSVCMYVVKVVDMSGPKARRKAARPMLLNPDVQNPDPRPE